MSDCNCNTLRRLEGPMHEGLKIYRCPDCGEQVEVKPAKIEVGYGKPAAQQVTSAE